MRAAIGITTYGGGSRLRELLASIHLRTPWLRETTVGIVVVDDGSPNLEETRRVCRDWRVPLVEHGRNRGISAGWNTATRFFSAPIAVLVNDDVIVSQGWLESLVHVLEKSSAVGVVGQSWHAFLSEDVPELLRDETSDVNVVPRDPVTKGQVFERRALYEDTNPARVMAPTGQLFAFRREDFDRIGGFDEGYLSFYEETCFGTSMAAIGKIGCQINWPFSWHRWSATFQASPELRAGERMQSSQARYRQKWSVPGEIPLGKECSDWTNPRHLGAVPDVEVEFLRKGGEIWRGVLRKDGAFVDGRRIG